MKTADLCIVGGGVVGAAIAWRCALQGAHVVLLEAKTIAHGASGAAAGMLAAQAEASAPGPLFEAAVASRTLLEQWMPQLEEESGIDVGYVRSGLLRTAKGPEEAAELQQRMAWQKEAGCRGVWLDADLLREAEPLLFTPPSDAARWSPPEGALFCPDDRQVIAPRLAVAFARAAQRAGAQVREGVPVEALRFSQERVCGVKLATGESIAAHTVIVAAGTRSARLLPQLIKPPFALTAVRGQMLALRPAVETVPNHTLFAGPGQYLVPKGNGLLLAGSVEEPAAVLAQPTLSTIAQLASNALQLVPALQTSYPVNVWAGLRPKLASGLPLIDAWPALPGLYVAVGHFRNGILLSGITAEIVVDDLLTQGGVPSFAQAFRFSAHESSVFSENEDHLSK